MKSVKSDFFKFPFFLSLGRPLCVAALSVAVGAAAGSARAAEVTGVWTTTDGEAHIKVSNCGDQLCGQIISLKDPLDKETGKPTKDKNNPDIGKRENPIVGVQLFQHMKPTGANSWHGQIYNPDDGHSYDATVTLEEPKLRVKGCALGGVICQSELWTR